MANRISSEKYFVKIGGTKIVFLPSMLKLKSEILNSKLKIFTIKNIILQHQKNNSLHAISYKPTLLDWKEVQTPKK